MPVVLEVVSVTPDKSQKYRILVTGAGRGIGRSIVEILKNDPVAHHLALTARSAEQLEQSAQGAKGEVLILPGDLLEPGTPEKIMAEVIKKWGGIDVLILNAGEGEAAPIDQTTDAMWDRAMRLNAQAPFAFIRAAVPAMKASGAGHIVVVATVDDRLLLVRQLVQHPHRHVAQRLEPNALAEPAKTADQ